MRGTCLYLLQTLLRFRGIRIAVLRCPPTRLPITYSQQEAGRRSSVRHQRTSSSAVDTDGACPDATTRETER